MSQRYHKVAEVGVLAWGIKKVEAAESAAAASASSSGGAHGEAAAASASSSGGAHGPAAGAEISGSQSGAAAAAEPPKKWFDVGSCVYYMDEDLGHREIIPCRVVQLKGDKIEVKLHGIGERVMLPLTKLYDTADKDLRGTRTAAFAARIAEGTGGAIISYLT